MAVIALLGENETIKAPTKPAVVARAVARLASTSICPVSSDSGREVRPTDSARGRDRSRGSPSHCREPIDRTIRTASSARSSTARSRRPESSRRPRPSPSSTSTRSIRGHTLVVPKGHHAHLSDVPDDVSAARRLALARLCRAIRAATGADGLNVIVNNGAAAGQTVDHCHWHIIPRFVDDPVNWPWPHSEYVGDELGQMKFRIERELNQQAESSKSDQPAL